MRTRICVQATEQLPLAARYATLVAAISANASGLLAHNVAFYKQLDTLEQVAILFLRHNIYRCSHIRNMSLLPS